MYIFSRCLSLYKQVGAKKKGKNKKERRKTKGKRVLGRFLSQIEARLEKLRVRVFFVCDLISFPLSFDGWIRGIHIDLLWNLIWLIGVWKWALHLVNSISRARWVTSTFEETFQVMKLWHINDLLSIHELWARVYIMIDYMCKR